MPPKTEYDSDGFEAIEYSSSSFSSSSTSSTSSSISTPSDNQNASNQTDQNEASKQPTELVYQLDFTNRDKIVLSLNRYTRVICGEKAETNAKLMKENIGLYQVLISLPLKSNAPTGSGSSKMVLDLNSSARSQIVNTLMANQSLIVDRDSASEESKMQLVEQNGKLIASLATLPVRFIAGSASATVSNDHADCSIKHAEPVGEVTRLKEIIEEQTVKNSELTRKNEELATKNEVLTKTIDEQATENSELSRKNEELATKNEVLTKTVEGQAAQISSLSREIGDCKKIKRIKEAGGLSEAINVQGEKFDLSTNKKRVDFECQLDEVFLEYNERRFSRYFYFNSLAWYLEFAMRVEGKNRFLSIFLRASSCVGGKDKWLANVFHVMSVVNQSGGEDSSLQCVKRFSADQPVYGWPTFISVDKLRTGFIKENKIKIRAALQLIELARTD